MSHRGFKARISRRLNDLPVSFTPNNPPTPAFLFKHQQELIANNLVFGLIEFQNINQMACGALLQT